jgi:hypothetical protein
MSGPPLGNGIILAAGCRFMTARKPAAVKRDLYREHKEEYAASSKPTVINVGPARYLEAAGKGMPGGPEFGSAMGSLFGAAYTAKFRHKAAGQDFKVSTPECLWELPPYSGRVRKADLATLPWRLILRVPEFVSQSDVKSAATRAAAKGEGGKTRVTLARLREGRCVQMLHVGPYSKEYLSVKTMAEAARSAGLSFSGPLHEIYLSDPRRVEPNRLKTILRIAVRKAGSAS